jgi:hypothetical protein
LQEALVRFDKRDDWPMREISVSHHIKIQEELRILTELLLTIFQNIPLQQNTCDCGVLSLFLLQGRLATNPMEDPERIKWGFSGTDSKLLRRSLQYTGKRWIDEGHVKMEVLEDYI